MTEDQENTEQELDNSRAFGDDLRRAIVERNRAASQRLWPKQVDNRKDDDDQEVS